jgi:hypothetical protein
MAETYFELPVTDQQEALEVGSQHLGRPTDLLEKDVYVTWALAALERAPFGRHVVFKGGTSLSKAHRVIDRFSEDVDLTYDLRTFAPDVAADGWPRSRSQAKAWTAAIQERLGDWVISEAVPRYRQTAEADGAPVRVEASVDVRRNAFDLLLHYRRIAPSASAYVAPTVKLEFGARGTGEPHAQHTIPSDAAAVPALSAITFPAATVSVLTAERTFWEKATAAHVYTHRTAFRGARGFARHWYDLARLHATGVAARAIADRPLAREVADWKTLFFREPGVDYADAVAGRLQVVPHGDALDALREDYAAMRLAGLFFTTAPDFDEVMRVCTEVEAHANETARSS